MGLFLFGCTGNHTSQSAKYEAMVLLDSIELDDFNIGVNYALNDCKYFGADHLSVFDLDSKQVFVSDEKNKLLLLYDSNKFQIKSNSIAVYVIEDTVFTYSHDDQRIEMITPNQVYFLNLDSLSKFEYLISNFKFVNRESYIFRALKYKPSMTLNGYYDNQSHLSIFSKVQMKSDSRQIGLPITLPQKHRDGLYFETTPIYTINNEGEFIYTFSHSDTIFNYNTGRYYVLPSTVDFKIDPYHLDSLEIYGYQSKKEVMDPSSIILASNESSIFLVFKCRSQLYNEEGILNSFLGSAFILICFDINNSLPVKIFRIPNSVLPTSIRVVDNKMFAMKKDYLIHNRILIYEL